MEKKMKYPYIGKGKHSGAVFLFVDKCAALTMHQGEYSYHSDFETDVQEGLCTDITQEYLQNTYGEVVSPEHAEFIIELAELHGFERTIYQEKRKHFAFVDNTLIFLVNPVYDREDKKQITIPLPPKADKQESSEWPQVGDEVVLVGGLCTVTSPADGHGTVAITNEKGFNLLVFKSDLSKPKTPEEELRDDILDCDNFAITESKATQLANWLTNKGYEIKKKPQ